jgi:lipoyl(octanoyl) transferase
MVKEAGCYTYGMPCPTCMVLMLGLMPFEEAWKLQDALAARIATGEHPPALLLLEHPHCYTFGRRGQVKNLIWDEAELKRRGISVHWVDRGGDVTYHGPGQLVGYPLLPLPTEGLQADPAGDTARIPQADYVGYVRKLEEVLILALDRMGVFAHRVKGMTGVWVQAPGSTAPPPAVQPAGLAKIAAIGVKVDARGVTRHGFALNVNPEMSYWQGIIACGLEGAAVTSLAALLPEAPTLTQASEMVAQAFGEVFNLQLIYPAETKHTLPG